MRLDARKDPDGGRLLDKFSKPRNPTKANPTTRIRLSDDPEDAARLVRYNTQDIAAEAAASRRCPDLTGVDLEYWLADQAINTRGVAIDLEGVHNCITIVEQAHAKYNAELLALTGIDAASKVQQLQGWLHSQGVHLDSLDEEAVDAALKQDLAPTVRRVLQIRQAIGSAAVKKLYAMSNQVAADGRLHDLFSFHAARTGRATGNGPQPTNLPNSGPELWLCDCGQYFGLHLRACPWCAASVT
jgi:DNA polymerase